MTALSTRGEDLAMNEPKELASATDVEQFSVVVIGGGQAGLAAGYHLAQRGIDFVILEKASRLGESWRRRWDSLRLFTPARYDGLPGFPFPGEERTYPTKDQMADYLEKYAERFGLPVLALGVINVSQVTPGNQRRGMLGALLRRHPPDRFQKEGLGLVVLAAHPVHARQ